MINLVRCRWCNGEGHLMEDCPQRVKPDNVTNKTIVTNKPVTNNVTNKEVSKGEVDRVLEWRGRNKEKFREYMREYMRRKRSA